MYSKKKCIYNLDICRWWRASEASPLCTLAGGRAKRARFGRATRGASEVRASAAIELRQGSGAQPPENFWDIIPSRVPFYNRVHFFTPVFKILKVVLYIQLYRIITSFVSASCILIFNGCLLIIKVVDGSHGWPKSAHIKFRKLRVYL